jgi:hypothetical protein
MLTLFVKMKGMDEDKIQSRARDEDERSTQQRAAILGLPYLDTRSIQDAIELIDGVMDVQDMHKNRIIPLIAGGDSTPWEFGITSQTPQSLIREIHSRYAAHAQNVVFHLISQGGYAHLMNRYDPPIKTIYDDISIGSEGDSDTIAEVSKTLNSVGSDEVFDFLIDQADKLGASDIAPSCIA